MPLTAAQKAALAKMPKNKRAAAAAGFAKQNQGNNGQSKAGGGRRLAQGVGALPKTPFGSRESGYSLAVWDATHPSHLPLPRAVGDYAVIRTTKRINNTKNVMLIGSFMREDQSAATNKWSNIIAVSDVISTNAINGTNNTDIHCMDLSGLGPSATVCPAAITVQIMNGGALQTTSGLSYIGVMKTQADWGGNSESWFTKAGQFVQYMAPRMCSAGKLALKGVKVSSYPLNMAVCSDFQEVISSTDSTLTWGPDVAAPTGWAPIVIYNPGEAALELLITVEWRVRFGLTTPASAAHTHHKCASDSTWDTMMQKASSLGHGVRDISETIAAAGQAAEGMGKIAALAAV